MGLCLSAVRQGIRHQPGNLPLWMWFMEVQQKLAKTSEEIWIAKYRAAIDGAPVQISAYDQYLALVEKSLRAVLARIRKFVDQWSRPLLTGPRAVPGSLSQVIAKEVRASTRKRNPVSTKTERRSQRTALRSPRSRRSQH